MDTNSVVKYSGNPQTLHMLGLAVEQTADDVMITDKQGVIEYVNPAFERTTGYSQEEVLGKTPKILQSGKHGKEYYQRLWTTILAGQVFHAQTTNKKKNGQFYIADQTVSPLMNDLGEITHFVVIWKDITEKVRLEERLNIEHQKIEEIVGFDEKVSTIRKFDRLIDFVVLKTMKILSARKCSVMLVDQETQELCIKGAEGLDDHLLEDTRIPIEGSILENVARRGETLLVKDVQSDPRFARFKRAFFLGQSFMSVPIKLENVVFGVINVADKNPSFEGQSSFDELDLKIFSALSREVAVAIENVRLYKELNFLTITDPLTNLYNFRHFVRTLDYEIIRAKRFSKSLTLMMIDIDHFKDYNDRFGREEGNKLLKIVAKILQENVREIDIICRYGGDEFAIILPETAREEALRIAEGIRLAIQESVQFLAPTTVSIGLGLYTSHLNRHDLTSVADRALYEAKHEGRNKVSIYG